MAVLALLTMLAAASCTPGPTPTPTPPAAAPTPTPPPQAPTATVGTTNHVVPLLVEACADPSEQLCTPVETITVWTDGTLIVEYTASTGHCSDVIAHFFIDGQATFTSPALAPGNGSGPQDAGPVSPGQHAVGIQGEGRVGGCNTGGVAAWSGTLAVTVSGLTGAEATPRVESPAP